MADLYDTEGNKTDATEPSEILRVAKERYDRCVEGERDNRTEAKDDLLFRAGEQWDDDIKRERTDDGRPVLTINRIPQFIRQVTGDIRINRPAIRVRPVDGKADKDVAGIMTGLIRNIEQVSKARSAYVTAAETAATCGAGNFRIITEYSTDDAFEQDIRIRRIPSPFAVYWDPDATEVTKEDARYCFVIEHVALDAFKDRWPDASTSDFDERATEEYGVNWWDGKQVTVAEYWCKKPVRKTLGITAENQVLDLDDDAKWSWPFLGIEDTRVVETHEIVSYMLSGMEILSGPSAWPGRYIPVVPVIGEEVHMGDRTVRHGVVRYAKDPQRLYNYWRSTAAETIALAPKAPFVGTLKQFKGLERFWKAANRSNLPYLAYNPDGQAPPPQRQGHGEVPIAVVNEAGIAADDMKAVTGIYDAALGARSNETSGRAILARQREGDVGTFVYVDNLSFAIEQAGRILVDLIPRIYDTERVVRVLGEDDTEEFVAVNRTVRGPDGDSILNDLSAGEYDVTVTTGPSYSTKREEAAQSMIAFVQANPRIAGIVMDLIAKNMDWPGAEQIAERLKKTLPPGIDDEAPRQAPAPPDPEAILDAAKVEKTRAETEGKELDNARKQLEIATQLGAIQDAVRQTVTATMMELLRPSEIPGGPARPGFEPGAFMPSAEGEPQ